MPSVSNIDASIPLKTRMPSIMCGTRRVRTEKCASGVAEISAMICKCKRGLFFFVHDFNNFQKGMKSAGASD